jgi:hypothetical protein
LTRTLQRDEPRVPHPPFRPTRTAPALAAACLVALAACGNNDDDPFRPRATAETALASFVVYPLSGDPTLPAAIDLVGRRAVRPVLLGGSLLNFDLALDVDGQGRVVLLPPSRVATPPTGAPRTGLQVVNGGFDAIVSAPRSGYRFDSTTVVTPGQTVVIEASGATCNPTYPLHAKLVVDSVGRSAGRPVFVRMRVNPNCGFRSLEPGLPKD